MKKFLKKSLIYLIMTVLALPVSVIIGYSGAEKAQAAATEIVNEGFDGGVIVPTGWDFAGIEGTYSSDGNYGLASPSIKFDGTGDMIVTPIFSDATNLSFWMKGQGSDLTGSSLLIETSNGVSWSIVDNISDLPSTGTRKPYTLNSDVIQVRLTYTKGSGNLSIDDVQISKEDDELPTVVTIFDDSYVISQYDSGHEVDIPIEYSEPMDQAIVPTIKFDQNDDLFQKVLDCTGGWADEKIYNYHCVVKDDLDSKIEIPASTATISGAKDLAGNLQVPFTTEGTLAVDLVLPVLQIAFPKDGARVNGTEKIKFLASEEVDAFCSVIGGDDPLDWFRCQSDITTINKLPGFDSLPDGELTFYFEAFDYSGNDPSYTINLVKDTSDPTATIQYSSTDPTNSSVVATLVPSELVIVTNTIDGSLDYTFTENGTFTFEFTDLAGNPGTALAIVNNINKDMILSPQIKTPVQVVGKTINLEWDVVTNALGYNIYVSSKKNGLVTSQSVKSNGDLIKELRYQTGVLEYGDYYVVVTAVDQYKNESQISADAAKQLLVNVPAPVVPAVTEPTETQAETPAQAVSPVAPQRAQAAVQPEPSPEQTVETPKDEGIIKGDEDMDEDDKTNWTPWIILFILIILAGAATGGYFYWFAGKDEENVEPKKKDAPKEKVSVTVREQKKTSNKKSKRW